jgi:hypothetical protein
MSALVMPAPPRAAAVEIVQGAVHVRASRMGERQGSEAVKFDLSSYADKGHAWGSIEISLHLLPVLRRAIDVMEGK